MRIVARSGSAAVMRAPTAQKERNFRWLALRSAGKKLIWTDKQDGLYTFKNQDRASPGIFLA
jgi:hypothetical protein